jgi:hypothetical protein
LYLHRITILTFFLLASISLDAQEYEFRFYLGANYYQGDLAPSTSKFSFSQGQLAWSTLLGVKLNDVLKVNAKFMMGKLLGRDSDSRNAGRKKRNLSFESPLYEFGINTEVNINHFLKGLNKFGVKVYYTTGINVFKFAPKTVIRNKFGEVEIIDLQPLGTEGQGFPGFDAKYNLTQINIPFGLGFRFHLFDNIEMGIELVPRITFTDYLDDVSGKYVSYEDLMAANRPDAAMLANRIGEYLGTGVVSLPTGASRGNPNDNDWYFFSGVYLSYNWGVGYKPLKFNTKPLEEDASEPQEPE